jgi:hypothetical protein
LEGNGGVIVDDDAAEDDDAVFDAAVQLDDVDEWVRRGIIDIDIDEYEWFRRGLKGGGFVGGVGCFLLGLFVVVGIYTLLDGWEPMGILWSLLIIAVLVLTGAVGGSVAGAAACRMVKGKNRWYGTVSLIAGVIGSIIGIIFLRYAYGYINSTFGI